MLLVIRGESFSKLSPLITFPFMQTGETNLQLLLQNMSPSLQEGDYVFCTVPPTFDSKSEAILATFLEKEGKTLVLAREIADRLGLEYYSVMSWITLEVHSSLDAVGLTAAFSNALAKAGISCNVIAGFYHDHIFVGKADAGRAVEVLQAIKR